MIDDLFLLLVFLSAFLGFLAAGACVSEFLDRYQQARELRK